MKRVEKWFHIIPWLVFLVFGILGLSIGMYGPLSVFCGVSFKGIVTHYWGSIIFDICAILYVAIVMYIVYKYVLSLEKTKDKISFTASISVSSLSRKSLRRKREKSRRIMVQGILYSMSMFVTYFPTFITVFVAVHLQKLPFGVFFTASILSPLQGFHNCFIYLLPRFVDRKKQKAKRNEKAKSITSISNAFQH